MYALRTTTIVLCAVGLMLAACGDGETNPPAAPTTTPSRPTTTAPAVEPVPGTITVAAGDYHFHDLPKTIAAGSRLALTNTSDAELHELVALRLPDDESRSIEELVALPKSELDAIVGGPPDTVLIAPPGNDGFAVVGDGTLAEAGRYLLLCAIPTGADPAEYLAAAAAGGGPPPTGVAGGPPHLLAGMYAELEVVPAP